MKQNFSELYEIIRNKFILEHGGKDSLPAMAEFLGHSHKGKVTAWSKGQWPSAQDCWILHKKMGLNLEWLLTGEGDLFAEKQRHNEPEVTELLRENRQLRIRIEQLEKGVEEFHASASGMSSAARLSDGDNS